MALFLYCSYFFYTVSNFCSSSSILAWSILCCSDNLTWILRNYSRGDSSYSAACFISASSFFCYSWRSFGYSSVLYERVSYSYLAYHFSICCLYIFRSFFCFWISDWRSWFPLTLWFYYLRSKFSFLSLINYVYSSSQYTFI